MTEAQKRDDWIRWVKSSNGDYLPKAIWAVWKNDGEGMLNQVLKACKLERTVDVIKGMG